MQEVADVDLLKEGDFVAVKLENYRRTPVTGKVFEVKEDGFVIVTGRDLKIRNGYLTRFPHVEGMKAGYGHSNYQKGASYVSDLRWMIVQTESFYKE